MNPDPDDTWFKTSFRELRTADARNAPPFSQVLDSAVGRTRKRRGRPRILRAVAVGASTIAALLLILTRTANFPPREPATAQLFQWRPPTEGLLKPFGEELLRGAPRVGESLMHIEATIKK